MGFSGATLQDIMNPFVQLINFSQTKIFWIGEFPVTFLDIWYWTCGGAIFIKALQEFYDHWQ